MNRLDELRAQWLKASEKDRTNDAIKALVELEKLELSEPRWSQRLGESYRRANRTPEAVEAFARAFQRYFERGFLPRAIAMAKLVKSLDAARGDLLEASLAKAGPGVPPPPAFGRPVGAPVPAARAPIAPAAAAPPAKTVVKPPPLATGDGPKPPRQVTPPAAAAPPPPPPATRPAAPAAPPPAVVLPRPVEPPPLAVAPAPSLVPPSPPVRPAPLARAQDSKDDEIRFDDAPESSLEILLSDLSSASSITVDIDDEPPTLDAADLPPPSTTEEPELDAYATMATFRLFAALSRDALVALSNAAELIEFQPGAMIIVRDERAFALYAIVTGNARVHVTGSNAKFELREGDIFGEASLLDEGQRQADVRAESPLMTLRIEKRALDEVTKEYPEVEDALFDLLARRLVTNLMHTSPLFSAFEPAVRLELAQKFEVRRAPPGTVLAERGRRSDGLYVLLAGHVVAEAEKAAPARIARGSAFGHASLLGAAPADTTVRAVSEAVLLRMPAAAFSSLAALYPPALAHLAETAHEPIPVSRRAP